MKAVNVEVVFILFVSSTRLMRWARPMRTMELNGSCGLHKLAVKIIFTSTVFPTQVGKSPHVAQSNCITHARQEEIKFPPPCLSGRDLLFLLVGLHVQWLGLVAIRGHFAQFCDLSVRSGAVRRHVSGSGRGPGSRTGGFSTGPRRQQLRGFSTPNLWERMCGDEACADTARQSPLTWKREQSSCSVCVRTRWKCGYLWSKCGHIGQHLRLQLQWNNIDF